MDLLKECDFRWSGPSVCDFSIQAPFFHIYLNVAHHERLVNETMWQNGFLIIQIIKRLAGVAFFK